MTRTLKIATFAILATAGAASAMNTPADLANQVEHATGSYGITVDANELSATQLRNILQVANSGDSAGDVRAKIASIAK